MAATETSIVRQPVQNPLAIEKALIENDLSGLTTDGRLSYYKQVCESVGLNPLTQPLGYLKLNGKTVLYAKKDATDQLRKIHGVSVNKLENQRIEDVYVVTAYGTDKGGRTDSATGAVTIGAMKGDNLANALMKAETKAKRRLTLSICGLGMLDETEIETVRTAVPMNDEPVETITGELSEQRTQGGKTWWNVNGSLVFCDEQNTSAEYSRLLDQAGKTATVTGWFRKEHDGKKVYELAEVVKVEAPKVADDSGIFEAKVISVMEKNDKKGGKFLSVWTDRKEHPLDNLSITLQCFHKSLGPALKDCIDRVCKFSVKRNGSYINIEDVLEVEGIAYKDGKIAD